MALAELVLIVAAVTAAPPAAAPPPARVLAPLPGPSHPFRLGLAYTRVLGETGDLAHDDYKTQALALHWTFASSTYVRNHLELGQQWESAGPYSARGFRIDLISFGYPIRIVDRAVRFEIEPIVTPVRGEIMFVSGGGKILRMEGGVGLDFLVTTHGWYVGLQPFAIDFRYWERTSTLSRTGFTQLFPLRISVGHEF